MEWMVMRLVWLKGSQSARSTSPAARSPDRIAPSMVPCDTVAVSGPAPWVRPPGAGRGRADLGAPPRWHVRHRAAARPRLRRPVDVLVVHGVRGARPEARRERLEHHAAALAGILRPERAPVRPERELGEHARDTGDRRRVQGHLE